MTPQATSAVETAHRLLQRKVIELELAPGALVSAGGLARDIGVGLMPVRIALARLQAEGFLEPEPKVGWRVAAMTPRDFEELCDVRRLLEAEAASLAAAAATRPAYDANRLRELDGLCQASYEVTYPSTITAFLRRNAEFHIGIAEMSSRRLAMTLRHVLDAQERFFHLLLRENLLQDLIAHEHKSLLEMIEAGDSRAARSEVVSQDRAIRKRTLDALHASHLIADRNLVGGDHVGP